MAKNVLPEQGMFDTYLIYTNPPEKLKKALSLTRLFFDLKRKKFDCLFYLSTRLRIQSQIERDLKFFRSTGITEIFGTDHLKKNNLNFENSRPLPMVEPEYRFLLDCLPFETGGQISGCDHDLALTGWEKNKAREWLGDKCGKDFENKKLIAVAPGSKWESKKWFEVRFVEVLRRLVYKYDVFPIIFGGKEDFLIGQSILSNFRKGANAAGELNIREAAAAIKYCKLYLGNDTGTMHLAAAAGTPCIGIFAAIDYPGRWYPFGEHNKIFRYQVECEGCHTPVCFNEHKCLEMISASEVFSACCEILDR